MYKKAVLFYNALFYFLLCLNQAWGTKGKALGVYYTSSVINSKIVKGRTWLAVMIISSSSTVIGYTHLDVREVSLERVGAGVSCVEEHELGFLQMTGRQAFLGVHMRPVKEEQLYNPPTATHHHASPLSDKRIFPQL